MTNVVARLSFFVNAGLRFIEEVCKLRALSLLWERLGRERYGVTDAKALRFRYGVQVNSLGLTEAQPENNVYRILLEMLAVTLSKDVRARAVQLPAWNEALGLPRPWDQQWSLRCQQVLAYETDLLEYPDIFEGSRVIDEKTRAIAESAWREVEEVQRLGGAVACVQSGYIKERLVESNALRLRADRARDAHGGRREPLHGDRAVAARRGRRRRRRRDPHRRPGRRGGPGGERPRVARGARREGRARAPSRRCGAASRGART